MRRQPNRPEFDIRSALFALLDNDLRQIKGLGQGTQWPFLNKRRPPWEIAPAIAGSDQSEPWIAMAGILPRHLVSRGAVAPPKGISLR
jgi:hypothetical protein